jgi:hypothetical protein
VKSRRSRPPLSTVTPRARHTTVPKEGPPKEAKPPKPPLRPATPRPVPRRTRWGTSTAPRRQASRLIEPDDPTLVDVIDNLLDKGVVLSAELILSLADVDLVYVRLSALLCSADRVLPRGSA